MFLLRINVTMGEFAHSLASRPMNGVVHVVSGLVLLAAVGLLSASLLPGCSAKPDPPTEQPISQTASGMVCTNPKWDLGEVVVKGGSVDFDHTFRLENRSVKTIKLREVLSGCGCLVAENYSKTIEAGGETEIKVTMSVFGPPGPFSQRIVVKEESESNEAIPLSVVGSRAISDLLYASPPTINFGTLTQGESRTKQLVLSRYDGSAVNFRALVAADQSFSLGGEPGSLTRVDFAGRRHNCVELPIRLDLKSQPVGPFRSKVTIRTDSADENTAELDVAVEAMIVEKETPWVQSIFVNRLERGATVELPITDQGGPVDCPEVISTSYEGDESIRVRVVPASPDGGSAVPPRVRVSRPVDSTAGGLARGTLSIRTEGPTRGPVTRIGIAAFLPQ